MMSHGCRKRCKTRFQDEFKRGNAAGKFVCVKYIAREAGTSTQCGARSDSVGCTFSIEATVTANGCLVQESAAGGRIEVGGGQDA